MNNILFLSTDPQKGKGGVASVIKEYKNIFPEAHFVSTTSTSGGFENLRTLIKGIFQTLYLLLFRKEIEIIHIHGSSYNSFYRKFVLFQLCSLFNKKIIYHIHGAEFHLFYQNSNRFTKKIIHHFIDNVDCLICLSQKWKLFFNNTFNPRRIELIPNIVPNISSINKSSNFKKPLKFLFLGHISERKGIWLLIETIKDYSSDFIGEIVFQIGGNGETEQLEQLIEDYNLADTVKYIGYISGEEKQELLSSADVYILPSYNEGLPISILEAMSNSLPILSTAVGGIPEIVSSMNGQLIEPGNKSELWKAIQFFIHADHNTLKLMGEESCKKIQPHMPEAVKQKLEYLYKSL